MLRRRSHVLCCAALLAGILAAGCGGGSGSNATVEVSPSTVTVLVGTTQLFTAIVANSNATVTWAVNGIAASSTANGGNATVGTIDVNGLYTAPASVPPGVTITITASVSNPSASGSAIVTLDSGARVSVNGSGCSIGTGETYQFTASVTGVPASSGVPPNAVTWAVTSGTGSIDSNTGVFTAPTGTETDTIKATSVYDTTQSASSSVTIVSATAPSFSGVSPNAGARGALFQDIYLIGGANVICTTNVLVTAGSLTLPLPSAISASSSTLIARVFDTFLDQFKNQADSSGNLTLTFSVQQQGGTPIPCSNGGTSCQVVLSPVRPAIVGTSPNAISGSGTLATIDGGFFGTQATPLVNLTLNGQTQSATVNNDRQLTAQLSATGLPVGLYPLAAVNKYPPHPVAVSNIAVEPTSATPVSPLTVGTGPAAVAVDTATGIAVIVNQNSNSISLVQMGSSPSVVGSPLFGFSAPVAVAVDNLRHIALVANSAGNSSTPCPNSTAQNPVFCPSIAIVDISNPASPSILSSIIPDNATLISGRGVVPTPIGVGVNPVTGRGIIIYSNSGFSTLLDLTPIDQNRTNPPAFAGTVTMGTGPNSRVTVSPKLNWAVATPGSNGSLSIVDLNRQTVNQIAGASQSGGTVTVTTASTHALSVGDAVLIQCLSDNSYNGEYNITSVPSSTSFTYNQTTAQASAGPSSNAPCNGVATVSYAHPVAQIAAPSNQTGVSINDETQQVILADINPSVDAGTWADIFNPLSQSFTGVQGQPGGFGTLTTGAAFDPLNNIAVVTNPGSDAAVLIDPSTPTALTPVSGFNGPTDVAVDPATNSAIIANYGNGSGNTVSILSLGSFTSAPQVLQVNLCSATSVSNPCTPIVSGPTTSGPSVVIFSSLTSAPSVAQQILEIIGANFTSTSTVELDGSAIPTSCPGTCTGRVLIATVPASMLSGPRRFALQVANGATLSNAASFAVIQSVDVSGGCAASAPQGVVVDATHNLAVISDPGANATCNQLAVVNLANGTGYYSSPIALTGKNPQGVGVLPYSGLAVVAEEDTNTADIVDETGGTGIVATVSTDASPTAVAVDVGSGNAVVTATNANVLDMFPVNSSPGTPQTFSVGGGPDAVAVDPTTHNAVVANANSNSVSVISLSGGTPPQPTAQIQLPTGVAFDPSSGTYFVAASTFNSVYVVNLSTLQTPSFGVGINPTSIAYNFNTSTMVTANFLSHTMTVVDMENPSLPSVRAVLSVSPSSQFAVDIHPQTNVAVLAESAPQGSECNNSGHGCVLLLPLPR